MVSACIDLAGVQKRSHMCSALHLHMCMPFREVTSTVYVSDSSCGGHTVTVCTLLCRYLGEVGSTRLPLRSIAENTIGQKLAYQAVSQENELPPLFAAIRSNTSIQVMSVHSMKGKDILSVRNTLQLDTVLSYFRAAHFNAVCELYLGRSILS